MASLKKYLALMKQYPSLFANPEGESVIKIITDQKVIRKKQAEIKADLRKEGHPESWIDIGVLVDDPWFLVIRDLVEFPGGHIGGYIRFINRKSLEGGAGAVVLPVHRGKILLNRHFRHAERDWSWEIPRGFGETGLSAEENARKELLEETGLTASVLKPLGSGIPDSGASADAVGFFYAELDKPNRKIAPEGYKEGIADHRWVTPSEFEALVVNGELQDAFSILAYSMAKIQGLLKVAG